MPEYIPRPQLPTGLVEQTNNMEAHKSDPWAALAMHIGESVKEGVKNYQARQPFSPEQAATLNKGEVPANLPKSQAAPLYESANKRKEAEALLASRQDQQNYIAANKEMHEKEMEGLKAGHQAELQKMKDETAQAVAQEKENAAKMISEAKAQHAKELADQRAQTQKAIAALKISDPAAAMKFAEIDEKAQSTLLGKAKKAIGMGPKFTPPSSVLKQKLPDGKIMVQDKEGKKHYLPKEQRAEAESQGYTVVSE